MRDRFLVLLLALAALSGCYYKPRLPPGTCENDKLGEMQSPDKAWKSVMFHRQCGDEALEFDISVLPAAAVLPNEPGNAFRQDSSPEGTHSSHSVYQRWNGSRELQINHDETTRVMLAASQVGPVRIVHGVGEFHEP